MYLTNTLTGCEVFTPYYLIKVLLSLVSYRDFHLTPDNPQGGFLFSARRVSETVGGSESKANRALLMLEEMGLLIRTGEGNHRVYTVKDNFNISE